MKVKDYLGSALADMNIHRHNCDFTDDERDVYRNETEALGFDFSDPEKMNADEKRVARDADQAESQSDHGEDGEEPANEKSSYGGDIANAYDYCMSMTTSLAFCGPRALPTSVVAELGSLPQFVGAMYTNGKRCDPDFAGLQEFEDEDQLLDLAL